MAEGLPREEVERMLFFEDARARAEAEHKQTRTTRKCSRDGAARCWSWRTFDRAQRPWT